jgi:serine/threonine protein phosphatase PrpC
MTAEFHNLRWQAFRLSRRGHSADEYEDAFAGAPEAGRFAIADGASEASFAGVWARVLVEGFLQAPDRPWKELSWLGPQRQRWAEQVDSLSLAWYAEEKREQGAFATFLGLALRPASANQPGRWHALAVGDSCLFHVRGERVLTSFPLTARAEFGNQPALLGSRAGGSNVSSDQAKGRWQRDDRFLLMTDALAQWFLGQAEEGRSPLQSIDDLLVQAAPQEAFPDWVEERRQHEGLRNDDVTLVIIDTLESP